MNINKWLKDHPVDCRRGAPLGDRGDRGPRDDNYRFHLQRIIFVDIDYDRAGTYWGGGGGPLYGFMCYDDEDGVVRGFVRAWDRADAKEEVKSEYPNARFYK